MRALHKRECLQVREQFLYVILIHYGFGIYFDHFFIVRPRLAVGDTYAILYRYTGVGVLICIHGCVHLKA